MYWVWVSCPDPHKYQIASWRPERPYIKVVFWKSSYHCHSDAMVAVQSLIQQDVTKVIWTWLVSYLKRTSKIEDSRVEIPVLWSSHFGIQGKGGSKKMKSKEPGAKATYKWNLVRKRWLITCNGDLGYHLRASVECNTGLEDCLQRLA